MEEKQRNKVGYYSVIPSKILYNKELKANEKLLYAMITSLAYKEGYCFATNNYFAEELGVHPKTVSSWISDLRDKNISGKNNTEVNKLFFQVIISYLKDNMKILDIGTGNGYVLKVISEETTKKIHLYGNDNSEAMLKKAKENLNKKVFSGLIWKFGERFTAELVTFVVSIVLARLLMPDDYGVIALMMVFITIANVFVINGFGNALIQKKNADNRDFSSVFYFNIIFSIAVYFILFAFAPAIARFYHMPVICPALRVLSLRIVIASVNSVQQAYVSRNMLFKRFFWSTLFGTLLSGVVGIVMAYKGCGIWAIVAQYLTNTCVDTIVLWITVKWRPEKYFSFRNLGELISYGWKILVSGLLDTGYNQLRNLVIGKKYSSADLAQYNKGQQYPQLIVTNVISSISGVLFPAISKCQDDLNNVKNITRRAIKVSSYVMWPLMIGLAVIARPLVIVMLTEKWLPCVPFVWIACFTFGLYPIHSSNQEAIKALGRSDLFLRLEIIKKTIGVTILIISMRYGVMAIALSQIVTSILSTFINASPNRKLLGYSYIEQIKDMIPSFALAVAMGIVIYPLAFIIKNNILLIIAQVIAGIFIYIGLTKVFKNDNLSYLLKFVKRKRQ